LYVYEATHEFQVGIEAGYLDDHAGFIKLLVINFATALYEFTNGDSHIFGLLSVEDGIITLVEPFYAGLLLLITAFTVTAVVVLIILTRLKAGAE
jgi:hypothetical protein